MLLKYKLVNFQSFIEKLYFYIQDVLKCSKDIQRALISDKTFN